MSDAPIVVHPAPNSPSFFRINGIGPTIAGRLTDPSMAPSYYKQVVFTFLFIPIFLGRIYLVRDGEKGGWFIQGWVSGRDLATRYGSAAYWAFKLRVLAGSVGPVLVAALVVGVIAAVVAFVFFPKGQMPS